METTRVTIDEAHSLDIINGEELQNQPAESQQVYNDYINTNGILLFWARNAKEFDEYNRPTAWHYVWGELSVDIVIVYKYSNKRDWSPLNQSVKLSKTKENV